MSSPAGRRAECSFGVAPPGERSAAEPAPNGGFARWIKPRAAPPGGGGRAHCLCGGIARNCQASGWACRCSDWQPALLRAGHQDPPPPPPPPPPEKPPPEKPLDPLPPEEAEWVAIQLLVAEANW